MHNIERNILKQISLAASREMQSPAEGYSTTLTFDNDEMGRIHAYKVVEILRENRLLPGDDKKDIMREDLINMGPNLKLADTAFLAVKKDDPKKIVLEVRFPNKAPSEVKYDIGWLLMEERIKEEAPSPLKPLEPAFESLFKAAGIKAGPIKAVNKEIVVPVTLDDLAAGNTRNLFVAYFNAHVVEYGDLRYAPLFEDMGPTQRNIRFALPDGKLDELKSALFKADVSLRSRMGKTWSERVMDPSFVSGEGLKLQ